MTPTRKQVIAAIETVRGMYSEDVFPVGGTSLDCKSADMARLTCDNILKELNLWHSSAVEPPEVRSDDVENKSYLTEEQKRCNADLHSPEESTITYAPQCEAKAIDAARELREECVGLIGQIDLFAAREGEADFETGNAIKAVRKFDKAIAGKEV